MFLPNETHCSAVKAKVSKTLNMGLLMCDKWSHGGSPGPFYTCCFLYILLGNLYYIMYIYIMLYNGGDMFQFGKMRYVSVRDFKGKVLIDIREY
uniref:Activated RNA polymerase II transcriptional coactivator p15 n=1 Tax=Amphiprion percula TaxID=161767 RepID=A0A3P8T8H1_AMPPE